MPRWWGAEPLPILRRVLKAHLVLVLFLQSAMVIFFFVDNKLRGWQMVAGVVPAIFIGDLIFSLHNMLKHRRKSRRRISTHKAASIRMPRNQPSTSCSASTSNDVSLFQASPMHMMHPWGGEYMGDHDEEDAL